MNRRDLIKATVASASALSLPALVTAALAGSNTKLSIYDYPIPTTVDALRKGMEYFIAPYYKRGITNITPTGEKYVVYALSTQLPYRNYTITQVDNILLYSAWRTFITLYEQLDAPEQEILYWRDPIELTHKYYEKGNTVGLAKIHLRLNISGIKQYNVSMHKVEGSVGAVLYSAK